MKILAIRGCKSTLVGLFLYLFLSNFSLGQEVTQGLILPGPDKTIVVTAGVFPRQDGARKFAAPDARIRIERAEQGKRNFKKIGEVYFPASAIELNQRLGAMAPEILNKLQVVSIEAAYELLRREGPDTLGLLLINTDLQEALGLTFVDRSRDPEKGSTYRLVQQVEGKDIQEQLIDIGATLPSYSAKYTLSYISSSDSAVSVQWCATGAAPAHPFPLLARVYKQASHHDGFTEQARVFVLNQGVSDSSLVNYADLVTPGSNLAYYIQVEDFAGNKGIASDTVYTLAVSRGSIKPILNLQAKDTLSGIFLTWDSIPDEALYGGVQILKSRKVNSDFVVLDTIPAQESSYLDEQVIQSSVYYYRVRPLLVNMPGSDPMRYAEVTGYVGKQDEAIPATPSGLTLMPTKEGKIALSWQQGAELNLFGYYVLRGTSLRDMQVISSAVQDTRYVDSTLVPGFAGQLQYALQAISLNQQVSDTSEIASIAIQQPVNLTPPGGLAARWSDAVVALQWDDVMRRDAKVEGYMIYRKQSDAKGFEPMTKEMLRLPFFSDTSALSDASYSYAITSIDSWGNQSIFSPTAEVKAQELSTTMLPQALYLRNLSTGIEIFWPESDLSADAQYAVYRKQVGQNQFVKIGNTAVDKPFVDREVHSDQLYEYRLGAADGKGASSISNSIRRQ